VGHGSKKLKREALDEVVLRVMDALRKSRIALPYCAFNGGRDAWVDVGDKSVGVAALQAWLGLPNSACLHVGDQFLNVGNDIKARDVCPCLWITSPSETTKMLIHVMRFCEIEQKFVLGDLAGNGDDKEGGAAPVMDVWTGECSSPGRGY